jgi:hypothetical protein
VGCVAVAVVVAWWPADEWLVRVDAADRQGACVVGIDDDERQCLAYTPEFPSEARYEVGECLRLRRIYRTDVPPHAERVECPPD